MTVVEKKGIQMLRPAQAMHGQDGWRHTTDLLCVAAEIQVQSQTATWPATKGKNVGRYLLP